MTFEYLYEMKATGEIDVEDIGNCAIVAYNSRMYQRAVLIIKTVEGESRVVISGPHWVELEQPCTEYTFSFSSFQFSSSKIEKIIDRFLSGTKFYVDQAEVVEQEEALKYIPDVREYIAKWLKEKKFKIGVEKLSDL